MMKMFNLYNKSDLLAQDIQVEVLAEAEVQIKVKSDQIFVKTKIKISHLQVITRVRLKVDVCLEDNLLGLEASLLPTENKNMLWRL